MTYSPSQNNIQLYDINNNNIDNINNTHNINNNYNIDGNNDNDNNVSNDNNDYDDNETCIICLEDINQKESINACNCKNKVHVICLLKWIDYKNNIQCEICNELYSIPNNIIINVLNNEYNSEVNYTIDNNNTTNPHIDSDDSNSDDSNSDDENNNTYINRNINNRFIVYYTMFVVPILCFSIGIFSITYKVLND